MPRKPKPTLIGSRVIKRKAFSGELETVTVLAVNAHYVTVRGEARGAFGAPIAFIFRHEFDVLVKAAQIKPALKRAA